MLTRRAHLCSGRPPRLRKGLFSWIPVVFRTKENVLINTVGLDAIMLLRFFKMGYRMFAVFTVLGMGVLAPVNFYAHPPPLANATTGYQIEDLMLPALSVDNVPNKSKYLRVHMAFTWLFSLLTIAYVVAHYRGFVRLKMQYDEHALRQTKMSKIEMRSVMVFGIPREMRNEIDLASYFESLGVGNVESVVLCRNWSHLRNAIQKRAHFLNKLETVFAQVARRHAANERTSARNGRREILRGNSAVRVSSLLSPEHAPLLPRGAFASTESVNPAAIEVLSRIDAMNSSWRPQHRTGFLGLFGTLVDSAEFYAAKFHEWDRLVERFRRMPERSAPTAVGIVTFESPTLVSQAVLQRRPFACMTKMAPEPRDMYWPNLSSKTASSYTKAIRGLLVYGSLFMLVFFSTFIVSSIAGLIDLGQLAVYVPVLGAILKDIPDTWIQFIQGVIPAALLTLWTSSLPSVLLILCQIQGIEASSWIEMSLLTKYFSYQLWNILFLTVFARTFVYEIIPNPQMVIELLGQMVPKSSTTLINYVILQAAAVYPAQLLLVAPLILTWLSRFSPLSRSTPRQTSDAYYPSVLTCINYGVAYPVPMIIFVIGVVYAPIAPLILPFCALFFAVGYFVYKYLLMYVHLPRYESKGIATRLVVNRCLSSLIIMQLTMMGLLALKASGDGARKKAGQGGMQTLLSEPTPWSDYAQMVSGVLPLLAITMFVYGWLSQGYDKQIIHIPLEILGKIANEFATRSVGSTGGGAMALDAEAQRTMSDEEERLSLGIHLEPPMTRVPGVLDAPVEAASAVLRYGDDAELDGHAARRRSTDTDPAREDIQLRTYVHPALIGKLPVPWLPGREQPQRLVELREEQARTQREVWRRLVAQQRVGMQAATEDDHLAADGVPDQPGAAPQRNGGRRLPRHSSGPLPTRPDFFDPDDELGLSIDEVHAQSRAGRGRGGPVLGRIRSFVDGFTSWVHLTMS
nr:hypothetical protein HK105_000364 [Polyrhizophydium stewartii]